MNWHVIVVWENAELLTLCNYIVHTNELLLISVEGQDDNQVVFSEVQITLRIFDNDGQYFHLSKCYTRVHP